MFVCRAFRRVLLEFYCHCFCFEFFQDKHVKGGSGRLPISVWIQADGDVSWPIRFVKNNYDYIRNVAMQFQL